MTTKTLTRADLTEAVFKAVGLSRNESAQMVEDMLEEVCGLAVARRDCEALLLRHLRRCAAKPSAWAATPRPATKCPSRPGACSCSAPAMCSSRTSMAGPNGGGR